MAWLDDDVPPLSGMVFFRGHSFLSRSSWFAGTLGVPFDRPFSPLGVIAAFRRSVLAGFLCLCSVDLFKWSSFPRASNSSGCFGHQAIPPLGFARPRIRASPMLPERHFQEFYLAFPRSMPWTPVFPFSAIIRPVGRIAAGVVYLQHLGFQTSFTPWSHGRPSVQCLPF